MPALFSFLGGIANGYNESKAAEAKALQEKRLEDKKQKGRMEIAKYEATQAQRRDVLKTMADGWLFSTTTMLQRKKKKRQWSTLGQ
jgi:hypothetical protein